jgi:hypothetical protein
MEQSDSRHAGRNRRNRYFRFKQMRAEEFEIEQRYFIERRRIINQAILGWGVACGFAVGLSDKKVKVSRGFALDAHGREIEQREAWVEIGPRNTFLLDRRAGECKLDTLEKGESGEFVLAVHYAERKECDAPGDDGCGCEPPEKRFVREMAVFTIERLKERVCGEPSCRVADYPCPDELTDCDKSNPRHRYFCRWSGDAGTGDPKHECRTISGIDVACEGVALARVNVTFSSPMQNCAPIAAIGIIDTCDPRRLLKSNELLYDMARGCDLTRIKNVAWNIWADGALIEFPRLAAALHFTAGSDTKNAFDVTFSGPVMIRTLKSEVISITALISDEGTGWLKPLRMPIQGLEPHPPSGGGDLTDGFTIVFDQKWVDDEVDDNRSLFNANPFTVEIEIFGDQILDCHGVPVDANAVGPDLPDDEQHSSGNGTPGGTFRSSFDVDKRAP